MLCPTRELADQVTQEIRRLARAEDNIKVLTLCGGAPIRPQVASLEHGAHIVVGTPGRIIDHLARGSLQLDALNTLVLDEADRMLDMGFFDDIASVAGQCPKARQTLLFSATYPEGMPAAGRSSSCASRSEVKLQRSATAAARSASASTRSREDQRLHAVALLLNHFRPVSTLAFCNTKQQCRDLVEVLQAQGFVALALHGELEQRERDQVLVQFRQPQLLGAGGHRRGRARPGHHPARGGDQRRHHARPRGARAPHRPHRPRREAGWAFSLASLDEMGRVGNIEQYRAARASGTSSTN